MSQRFQTSPAYSFLNQTVTEQHIKTNIINQTEMHSVGGQCECCYEAIHTPSSPSHWYNRFTSLMSSSVNSLDMSSGRTTFPAQHQQAMMVNVKTSVSLVVSEPWGWASWPAYSQNVAYSCSKRFAANHSADNVPDHWWSPSYLYPNSGLLRNTWA